MSSLSRIMVSAYVFEWKIDNYLHHARGTALKSGPFYAGADEESTWQMSFYPRGCLYCSTEYSSVSLKMTYGSLMKVSSKIALIIRDNIITEKDLHEIMHNEHLERFLVNFAKVIDISYPLLIRCELKISERKKTLPYVKRVDDFHQVLSDIHSLLSQQKETDVVITTRDKMEFSAHKIVLAARSEVFSAMFQSSMSENLEGRLEITDMDGSDVQEFLQYVYSGNLTKWSLSLCMNLFVAGDKYKMNTLKDTCSLYMQQNINAESSTNILVLADMHGDQKLKEVAFKFIRKNEEEVLKTHGWKTMVQEQQHLVDELILFMI